LVTFSELIYASIDFPNILDLFKPINYYLLDSHLYMGGGGQAEFPAISTALMFYIVPISIQIICIRHGLCYHSSLACLL
jgi:surface polysaccharide O-acyltransferase-like enzyme